MFIKLVRKETIIGLKGITNANYDCNHLCTVDRVSFIEDDETSYTRMTGSVSTANRGGFSSNSFHNHLISDMLVTLNTWIRGLPWQVN